MFQLRVKKFQKGLETLTSRVEVFKRIVCKAGFLKEVAETIASDLRRSAGKVVKIPPLVSWKNSLPI